MADVVEIFEVGPRDGLQNESVFIDTSQKIALVDGLAKAGLPRIECASFVSPKWVPQMADGSAVVLGSSRRVSDLYALALNARGLQDALISPVQGICMFVAATEGFNRANTNISRSSAIERVKLLIDNFKNYTDGSIALRGYISCVTDCPYDGKVAPSDVAEIAEILFQAGCDEISLGDTIGTAYPDQVDAMLAAVKERVPAHMLAGHYHDTAARALDNIDVSLEHGLRTFDASIAGLGGCPYAPGAKGNVGTEKVFDHLKSRGFSILGNPNRAVLAQVGDMARSIVGRPLNAI